MEETRKDLVVDGLPIAKDRPLQVGNFFPSARLIRNVGTSSVTTYVDNAFPFFSAYDNRTDIDGIPIQIEIINTQDINVATGLDSFCWWNSKFYNCHRWWIWI